MISGGGYRAGLFHLGFFVRTGPRTENLPPGVVPPLMTNNMPENDIQWINVEAGKIGNDHGVEFWHQDVKRCPVAFIVGYQWLHEPGRKSVTAQILRAQPESPGFGIGDWNDVVSDVKVSVGRFLVGPRQFRHDDEIGKVR